MIRALLAGVLAVLPIAGAAQSPSPPTTSSPAPAVSAASPAVAQRTLANGMRVVVVEDHAAAVVQTAMWYRFGSLDETPGRTGLAHGLEHMMFRGTHDVSGGGLDDIAARLGAAVNANTAEDYTHYYTVLPADKAELAIRLEADRMRGLLLRQSDWTLEKGAVLSEYDNDFSQPVFRLTSAVRAQLWAGSPYAHSALGVRADVVRSTAADLRRYYDEWYGPRNATLVVTGDVAADAVLAAAQRFFGPIAALPQRPQTARPVAVAAPKPNVSLTGEYPYTVVDLAYRVPGDLDPDAAPTQLFASLINNERSAFYKALVLSKRTIGYTAYADTAVHGGVFHVLLYVTPGVRAADARTAFESALAQVRANGVDADLLAAAKTAFARQSVYARDSIAGLGDRYGYAYGVEGHDPAVDDALMAALDPAVMNAAVAKWFNAPQVAGVLQPRTVKPGARPGAPPSSGVSDDFSKRAPAGPVVTAPWVRDALREPPRIASHVDPRTFTLPNGLRVFVQPVRTNPTVFVSGSIELSPSFDPPGRTGLGGLASGLVGYGSANYDFDAQRKLTDALGADVQLGASFSAHGLVRDLDRLLDLLADGVQRPAFPEKYVALVKAQEIASISQRDASPDYRADRAFSSLLYAPGDPALRQETIASVRAVDVPSLRAYAARYFRPDRTTLVIAGDIDPDAVRASIERAFGGWANNGPRPSVHAPPLPKAHTATRYVAAERDSISVRMGQPAIARTSPDFYAFNLLNGVLGAGGSFDTRLMHEIREQRGLVYGVSSSLTVSRERGLFEVDLSASPQNLASAVALARAEVRRLTREPVSTSELTRTKQKLIASTLVGEESTQAILERVDNIARNRLPANYYATLAQRYGNLDAARLLAVAKRYLHPDAFVTVYEGPLTAAPH
ncbi:MAG: zinc protease [Candidatus Eremiobacteraeota bacterium]|nr:zinc protease [Candidatus Eremiobacteraeota bacterium]